MGYGVVYGIDLDCLCEERNIQMNEEEINIQRFGECECVISR